MSAVDIVIVVVIVLAALLALILVGVGHERVAIPVETYPPVVGDKGTLRQTIYRLDPDFDGVDYVMASALETADVERVRLYEARRVTDRPDHTWFQLSSPEPLLTVRHTLDHGAALSELGYVAVRGG